MADATIVCFLMGIFMGLALAIIAMTGVKIIRPYEQGILEILGQYNRILHPGFNYVIPFVSRVQKIDLRERTLHVPGDEVYTKDDIPVQMDLEVVIKVQDAKKAWLIADDHVKKTMIFARNKLKVVIRDSEYDDILKKMHVINGKVRSKINRSAPKWGVWVVSVKGKIVDRRNEKRVM